jgi:hypothetical protein
MRHLDKRWRIFLEISKGWHWEHVDEEGNVSTAANAFWTEMDCLEDAKHHGLEWERADTRR